ncbi:hypothetical protein EVAR_67066_1 [Eumeta japonica]|uniref:Uncharacterized protein n=1 Tax=Eumeta variegata TaxID=151549 RepID=A0A4C1ZKZ6_EUMVA|nr:hypothetical protein EVAR_67066_1 [Eumeta japonica]
MKAKNSKKYQRILVVCIPFTPTYRGWKFHRDRAPRAYRPTWARPGLARPTRTVSQCTRLERNNTSRLRVLRVS